jgi:hypothetical protein
MPTINGFRQAKARCVQIVRLISRGEIDELPRIVAIALTPMYLIASCFGCGPWSDPLVCIDGVGDGDFKLISPNGNPILLYTDNRGTLAFAGWNPSAETDVCGLAARWRLEQQQEHETRLHEDPNLDWRSDDRDRWTYSAPENAVESRKRENTFSKSHFERLEHG